MAIELPNETKTALVASIRQYVEEELDREIGDLQASFFLEFVLEEVGPSIYNQALRDARLRLQGLADDLESTLYEPEFGFSAGGRRRR